MASPGPGRPSRETGLPPGVEVGGLGRRFVAYLIECLVPVIVGVALAFVLPGTTGTLRWVLTIVGALIIVAWALVVVYMQAEKAAGPGMRLMKLQLVGFYDGRPIGWGRVLLRAVILWLLSITGIGLLIMLITLLTHPRRQGWHDLAAKAVVIKERVLAPPADRMTAGQQPASIPPTPTYGPVAGYSAVPGGPSMPAPSAAPAPTPLAPPTGTGYPPAGYPGVGYPPGAEPYQPGGYPPRAPDSYPPRAPDSYPPRVPDQYPPRAPDAYPAIQPTPAPAAPMVAPAVASPTPGPAVIPSGRPAPEAQVQSSAPTSAPAPTPPERSRGPVEDWVAVLDDGRRLTVDRLVLLGRNPRPEPGEEDAQLVKIADETRTVSKLHLAIGLDANGLYVVDRGSTNGSTVTSPGGASKRCRPGDVVYVSPGSIVSMGDHWLEIRRDEL
jgi:uncharacterized RDD family membrane protein YckC